MAAPDRRTRSGRRDHALILLAVQAGLRLSELTGLRPQDLHLGTSAHVRVIGKGRKERCTPLSKNTRSVIAAWLRELPNVPDQPLFPSARGGHLSAHGVHYLLAKHVATATRTCPSLKRKRVSPHVLRHTTAMDLLQQGVEQAVIALWLGHESIETTQVHLDADLELKQEFSTPLRLSMESPVAIDPTTSSSRSSRACDNGGYVPSAYARIAQQSGSWRDET
ncbi:MAG TPA: tyrosine-type recombinase/integrase [Hyphomicrobiaceae bacterium]|nr:tyrosine-type recombinase/integrase [Hyphomicrobiaceae bacterium]